MQFQLKVGCDVIGVGTLQQCQAAQAALSELTTVQRQWINATDVRKIDSRLVVWERVISVAASEKPVVTIEEFDALYKESQQPETAAT